MIYDFHMSATMPKIRNLFVYYVKNNSNTQKNNKNKNDKTTGTVSLFDILMLDKSKSFNSVTSFGCCH